MRAFLGLEVPETARRALAKVRAAVDGLSQGHPGLRWTHPENLHLTVRFLGDIDESIGDILTARLRGTLRAFGPVMLNLDSVSWFPPRRPTVLAANVIPSERLLTLYSIVERDVVAVGLPEETRQVHPHITVARLRHRATKHLAGFEEELDVAFECRELILFRSRLLPTGAEYAHFDEIALGGPEQPSTS
jgi:2'-5' RNA ligase